jgi:hypothetical protein
MIRTFTQTRGDRLRPLSCRSKQLKSLCATLQPIEARLSLYQYSHPTKPHLQSLTVLDGHRIHNLSAFDNAKLPQGLATRFKRGHICLNVDAEHRFWPWKKGPV